MSTDNPLPPSRRVVVRLTPRDKNDPVALLAAVRSALSGHGVSIVVRTVEQESSAVDVQAAVPDPPAVVKDEVLETKARELAQAHLDAAAAEAEKKGAKAKRDIKLIEAEVAAQQAGLLAYLSYWLGQGVRITVEVYDRSVGAAVGVISRVLGGKGDKGE